MTSRSPRIYNDLSNDPDLIYDPQESTCTLAWDNRTTDNQAKCAKLFREIVKRANVHYIIQLNLHGPQTAEGWPRRIFPMTFPSKKDAWDFAILSPDPDLRGADVKSWSVEAVRTPKPKIIEPSVRRENLVKAPKPRRASRG